MKKFKYVSALLAALGMCGVMGYAPEVWGQEQNNENGLAPLVMIVFDTSGSMNAPFYDNNYTRLSRAMADLAGTPKTTPINHNLSIPGRRYYKIFNKEYNSNQQSKSRYSAEYMKLPRKFKTCNATQGCFFQTKCVNISGQGCTSWGCSNCNDVAVLPYITTDYKECLAHDYESDYDRNGVLHKYMYAVKMGFAGFNTSSRAYLYGNGEKSNKNIQDSDGKNIGDASDWKYSLTISDSYKTSGYGLDIASPDANTPMIYPSVSDKKEHIYETNQAVITNIRSYYAVSGTPLGAALADMYYMFTKPDPGIVAQPIEDYSSTNGTYKNLTNLVGTVDKKFACREKAVIFVSDGDPGSGVTGKDSNGEYKKGQLNEIWHDAGRLWDEGKVRVYPVAYAFDTPPGKCSQMDPKEDCKKSDCASTSDCTSSSTYWIAKLMNRVAWRGNTCRDKNGKLIDPNNEDAYLAFVNDPSTTVLQRSCYYNAYDSSALRNAFVKVLDDMLKGTTSKTAVATTTAVSQKHNYKKPDESPEKKWHNGYYSIYSGYNLTMGSIRKTSLQRTATICDHVDGTFKNKSEQFLDFGKRLNCRLVGCNDLTGTMYDKAESVGSSITGCMESQGPDSLEMTSGNINKCLNSRYIFTAKYDGAVSPLERYAISTFGDSGVKILRNVPITNTSYAGVIPRALNSSTESELEDARDANFLLDQNANYYDTKCSTDKTTAITNYATNINYVVSPYECGNDMDCMTDAATARVCDAGRCVNSDLFLNKECSSQDNLGNNKICIANYIRTLPSSACTSHSSCSDGEVCHAGSCVPGTIKSCDIRQFMASQRLGTIEYATPVTVAPPTKAYKSVSYQKFSTKYWKRDTMLMVAANDGMLHAFILGDNQEAGSYTDGTYDVTKGLDVDKNVKLDGHSGVKYANNREGDELWAFIPKTIYKNLHGLTEFGLQRFVNAKPVVADIRLPNGLTIDGVSWRTVLVGGFRESGRGYYALDITNPARPFVLWEIDHQWQSAKENVKYPDVRNDTNVVSIQEAIDNRNLLEGSTDAGFPFQLMGLSYSEPVITNMLIGNEVEPVAILSGGQSPSRLSDDMVGKALYIVRLYPKTKEDLLVKTFYFDEVITGTPEVYPNNFNSIAQHIYVGDGKGALYRLDVSGGDIKEWGNRNIAGNKASESMITVVSSKEGVDNITETYEHEKPIFNPSKMTGFNSQPFEAINYKPAVSLAYFYENKPAIQIAFGTGNNDDFNVSNTENHYVANFIDMPVQEGGYQLNASTALSCFQPTVMVMNTNLNSMDSVTDTKYGTQNYAILTKDPVNNVPFAPFQKMTGSALTYNFTTYFPTFVSVDTDDENNCELGRAYIWRMNSVLDSCTSINRYQTLSKSVQNQSNISGDHSNRVFATSSNIELSEGTKVYGLEVIDQLYCIKDGDADGNKILAPQLVLQTGAETAAYATDDGSALLGSSDVSIKSLSINLEAVRPEVSRVTWAGVYE